MMQVSANCFEDEPTRLSLFVLISW
jgi:hypothetical protein